MHQLITRFSEYPNTVPRNYQKFLGVGARVIQNGTRLQAMESRVYVICDSVLGATESPEVPLGGYLGVSLGMGACTVRPDSGEVNTKADQLL